MEMFGSGHKNPHIDAIYLSDKFRLYVFFRCDAYPEILTLDDSLTSQWDEIFKVILLFIYVNYTSLVHM